MKKYLYTIVFVVAFFTCFLVHAEEYIYRIRVLNDKTNLRNDPGGTDGTRVGLLSQNDYYVLVDNKLYEDVNNYKRCNGNWYYMNYYTGLNGYVCSDDVELITSYKSDTVEAQTECEIALKNAGFPSSYWGGLCKLKEKYPKWQFIGIDTGLEWDMAVEEESACGVNYIHGSVLDKNFLDNTCTSTSPGGYVAPSQTAVAYYMDPRNSFTEKYLFQFLDQSYDQTLNDFYQNGVETILTGTDFYSYHTSIGNDLKNIIISASVDKASPIAIASKMRVELGVGTSLQNLYKGIYDGFEGQYLDYYNFFNFGVTDSCVATNGTTYCGLNYAKKFEWKGVEAAISGGINQFSNGYILNNQYTGYFQKFNVIPKNASSLFVHQYMTNLAGARSEAVNAYQAYLKNGLLDVDLVFKIPVYNNMSATIINSSNGAVGEIETETKPSTIPISTIVTSSGYSYTSKYISKISPNTDVSAIKGALESVAGNATVNIVDKDGNTVTSGIIGTGFKVSINNQFSKEVLEVVIKGDTSGDGVINALDLLQVQKNILGTYTLTGPYILAADTSGDGEVNALDLLQVQKSILGTYEIIQ